MELLGYWLYELRFWFRRSPKKWPYDILIGSHGNERIWRHLWRRFRRRPMRRVRLRIVHKRAARLGKRFLGNKGQIMDRYSSHFWGGPKKPPAQLRTKVQ